MLYHVHDRRSLLASVLLAAISPSSLASTFPDRPIRIIVAFAAGPGPDFLARTLARKMEDKFGWTVMVENRPGAGGNLGTGDVAKAKPDGLTLLMGHVGALAVNPSIYAKLPFDPKKDLAPISMVGTAPLVLVTGTASRYKTLADVIAAGKRGDSVSYGYSGAGTISHLSGAMLGRASGFVFNNIPYKGASQGILDMMGGRLDLYMSSVATLTGHIQEGKVRPLAVTSPSRLPEFPDVPTVAEQGFDGFNATTWFALVAPAKTPPDIIEKLREAVAVALRDPDLVDKFRKAGTLPRASSAEELARFIASESVLWGRIAVESGAKVE